MKENLDLLYKMIEDMKIQDPLYKATSFWEEGSKVIVKEIEEQGIENFRSLNSSIGFFVPTYSYPNYYKNNKAFNNIKNEMDKVVIDKKLNTRFEMLLEGKTQAFSDFRVLESSNIDKKPYINKVSESEIGNPIEHFSFNNRRFSRSFLNYLLGLSFLKKHVDTTNISTVMEIGGGFGTLGEILVGEERNDIFYINADIPPVAYASTYYLTNSLGRENIATYEDLIDKKELNIYELRKEYKAMNICSWQVPNLKGKIDLFVNFISFQEMEPEVVKNYCKYITNLNPEFILLRNIKEGKKKKDENTLYGVEKPILGTDYDVFLPNYDLVTTDSLVYGFVTEDNFHSELRIYRRKENRNTHEN